jgi:hypothetical protein
MLGLLLAALFRLRRLVAQCADLTQRRVHAVFVLQDHGLVGQLFDFFVHYFAPSLR